MNLDISFGWQSIVLLGLCCILPACSSREDSENRGGRTPEGWQSLFDGETLSGWEPAQFGGEGWVRVKNGAIYLFQGDSLTGITWKRDFPTIDYEVSLQAQRVQGSDFFCALTFPVGDSYCTLIVGGWAGSVVGISNVDGQDASENETSRLKRFETGRWYQVRVRVSSVKVEAWIDQERFVELPLKGRELDVRPEVRLCRPFGIASWQTTAALRDIRIFYPLEQPHEKSAINP